MNTVEMTVRLRKLPAPKKGQGCYKSIVFRRAAAAPDAPDGGDYDNPVPSGWYDGIPPEAAGAPCWMTSRVFTSDGQPPQTDEWTDPQKVADTADIDYCFSAWKGTGTPPEPTVHGTQTGNDTSAANWHDEGAEDDIWMATSRCANGQWSDWSINRIKGEDAVFYSIEPSAQSIRKFADGTLSADSVSINVYKTVGDTRTSLNTLFSYVEYVLSVGDIAVPRRYTGAVSISPLTKYIKFTLYNSSAKETVLAESTVLVVADGQDGVGSYTLDLDNENVNIGLTSAGGNLYPASGYHTGGSGIYVTGGENTLAALTQVDAYIGNTLIATATSSTGGSYSSASLGISSLSLSQISGNSSSVTFTMSTTQARAQGEKIEIKLKGTISVDDSAGQRTVTAYKVLTIIFQSPGADGVSPTVYELKPSHRSVVIAPDGTRSPASVTCDVTQRVGNSYKVMTESEIQSAGLKVMYTKTIGTSSPPTEASSTSVSGVTALTWYLYHDEDVYDQEEIAFVKDGVDGADTWQVFASPSTVLVNRDEAYTTVLVQLTSTVGLENIPVGGATYPNWGVVGTGGVIVDGWISWSVQSTEGDTTVIKLICFPQNTNRESVVSIPVSLSSNTVDSVTRTIEIPVKTYHDGSDGNPGPAGLTYRKTELTTGVEYHNDTDLLGTVSPAYLDIGVRTGANGELIGVWQCLQTHDSTTDTLPPDNGSNDYWERLSTPGPIYTPLILADGACIGFIQGQQLKIFDTDGNLKAGISTASGSYPVFYANPTSEDTTTARWQQFENGSAQYGDPSGAKVFLNAAPSGGTLPHIGIYDTIGNISAVFDGSTYNDSSLLYGEETTLGFDGSFLKAAVDSVAMHLTKTETRTLSFSCDKECVLDIPAFKINTQLSIQIAAAESYDPSSPSVGTYKASSLVRMLLDGNLIAWSMTEIPESRGTGSSINATKDILPLTSIVLGAGDHTLSFSVKYDGVGIGADNETVRHTGYAQSWLSNINNSGVILNPLECTLSANRQMCRYFANGLAIGSAGNNYCMVWNSNGSEMNFIIRNSKHGIKVDSEGTFVLKNNEWRNLESLFT